MPVAKHHTPRATEVRARQMWTEGLTLLQASVYRVGQLDCVAVSGVCSPYPSYF